MKGNIVITMAGRGSRFQEAGYKVPKYEIVAHGRSLFDWSMLSLRNFLDSGTRVIYVCLMANRSADYVLSRSRSLGLADPHVVELSEITDGQATSAYLTKDLWLPDTPLLIYNIDTYVNPRSLGPEMIRPGSDGWVPCFDAPGEHWSFVSIGNEGWADRIAEKQRISNHASVGLYWFRQASQYADAYRQFFATDAHLVKGERYVAPVYSNLIGNGCKISIASLSPGDVHVLGTPRELDDFLALPESEIL